MWDKILLEKLDSLQDAHERFATHFLVAAISFGINHKELKIAQTAQIMLALSTFEPNLYGVN